MSLQDRDAALRGIVVVAVAMLAVAIGAIGLTIWALRYDAAEDAARDTENIATVLAEQIGRTVQAIDIVLDDLGERIAVADISTADEFRHAVSTRDYHNLLLDRLTRLPQASAFGITDNEGIVLNTTRGWPIPNVVNVSDRDYFVAHLRHEVRPLFVSKRQRNRANGAWSLQFSRRIEGRDGQFLGVAFVSVETTFFNEIFGTIQSLHDQKITLSNRDGSIVVRYPAPSNFAGSKNPANSTWHDLAVKGGGHARIVDDNGVAWLTAVKPLMSYPLVIGVGLSEDSAFATWRRRAIFIATGTLLILICSVFLLRAVIRQLRQMQASERSLADGKASLAEKSAALERANIQIDAALNNITQGVCMFDENGRLVVCNQRYIDMYGLSRRVAKPGCLLFDLITHRKDVGLFNGDVKKYCDEIEAMSRAGKAVTYPLETVDGRSIHIVQQPMEGGGWVVTHEDITERKRAEAQTAFMARHDALTGLANRHHLLERIGELFEKSRDGAGMFSVFAFDLDLFKAVNDSLGHPTGDALLKEVAMRLRDCAGNEVDIIARLGGDEFVLVQSASERQREKAIILANRLLEEVSAPYEIDGHQIVIGTSIGIALAPNDGDTADELLKHADLALYRVKSEGRNGYRFFEQEMDDEAQSRHLLQGDLRESLARKEFKLFYQTIFDAKTRMVCGAEALVRWQHPSRGTIPPAQFVQLAEEIGVIVPLGEWILAEACRIAAVWPAHIKIAVNLSPAQFRSPSLVDMVARVLADTGLAPDRLELEVTESVLLQKNANNLTTLYQLKSLGLSIVLDDFGTGYSSLGYLRMFPFDKIKIDRSFVSDLSTRADCAAIVCAVVGLGHGLNILTTAEGVETEEQFRLLRAAGVTQMQGFLLSKPRPAEDLEFSELPDSMEAA